MRLGSPDRWVILRFRGNAVSFRDDNGQMLRGTWDGSLPTEFDERLAKSIERARTEAVRVAICLQNLRLNYTYLADLLCKSPSLKDRSAPYQFIRMPSRRLSWPPFAPPLRIAAVGSAAERIAMFSNQPFAKEAQRAGGLTVTAVDPHLIASIGSDAHVVVANEIDALTVLYMTIDGRVRPRLVVAVAEQERSSLHEIMTYSWLNDVSLRTASVLFIPPLAASRVEQVLYGIVHDQPLHEIAAQLRTEGRSDQEAILVSDPGGLQSLRVSDAFFEAARRELAQEIGAVEIPTEHSAFLPFEIPVAPPARPLLNLPFESVRETGGFLPVAQSSAVSAWRLRALTLMTQNVSRPEVPQRRRVDARIERVETAPAELAHLPARDLIWLPPDRTLRNGGTYRLRVQIGRDFPGNLVSAAIPDLDSLLPPSEKDGWELHVVVFAKDFRLRSLSTKKLWLGRSGASDPLYFEIRAPVKRKVAELRFALYHGNHLLQSFLLTAIVTPEEIVEEGALRIDLDFAKSDAFANLETLEPRALSIGVNPDGQGAHRLLLKFDEIGKDIRIENSVVDQPLADFRKAMTEASVDNDDPVFPAEGPSVTSQQKAVFESTIRELARIGSLLYCAVFDRGFAVPGFRDKFRSLGEDHDLTLQFTRYDANFVMPWTIFYDYDLPDRPAGPVDVCNGMNGNDPCGHGTSPGVVCINGFWGVRHVIEEELAGHAANAIKTIQRLPGSASICIADGADDGSAKKLVAVLTASIAGNAVTTVEAQQRLLDDVLWKAESRSAIMMLLGHLDESGPERRIQVPGANQWLTALQITEYARKHGDWKQPNSLVLLMACNAMQASSSMLHGHALALCAAGAAAVVGPECPIFSPFACRVARQLVLALITGTPPCRLGQALTELRRALAADHNPLGFAFTAFGDSDVAIA